MRETPEELPETIDGIEGESDVVAERSGSDTRRTRRPISADLPEGDEEERRPYEEPEVDEDENVIRPDAGPTG
ncbi:hypothetical protein [Nonomuraea aridisoli]|uniref:Uncharacterized protein n=1 Tax=Nonomuraea aridisoli TaxID=2070368 RepID=A0A2W2F0K4_9ACTN|nr:hypothetical protein [Nonomuraea aridisoli]PZG19400.1 hypothetical protein C1J01_12440 [Nonomuraea aridisoli]